MSKIYMLFLAFAIQFATSSYGQSTELSVLARPGPWPVADELIVFRGRIWFSTAVKGVDHNSADIWSFNPATGTIRFERYLFSQDVGRPIVHKGLLYWPHEDMRDGRGAGVVSVTNGRDWRDLQLPSLDERMLHTHAMAEWRGHLIAAMAGWNSALFSSADAGKTWHMLVNDPPRVGSFHRYSDVVSLGDRLFIRHWERTGTSLAEFLDEEMVDVPGWPKNRYFTQMTVFRNTAYALVEAGNGRNEVWRVGSGQSERIDPGIGSANPRALASDGERLWLVARTRDGGQLWSSRDGAEFTRGASLTGGDPHSAVALGLGEIFVGGRGEDGRAILWGPLLVSEAVSELPFAALPKMTRRADASFDSDAAKRELTTTLGSVESYSGHGRALVTVIGRILARNPSPGFFRAFLDVDVPDVEIETFGGQFTVPAREIATWHLIGAIGRSGDMSVPVDTLVKPWRRESNRPQKWFDPLLIALHAIQQTGQNDGATLDALIDRLNRPDDPDWLRSQVTGTLSAITGKRFAHDDAAWQAWWRTARTTWPMATPGQ